MSDPTTTTTTTTSSSTAPNNAASLISGHAQYAKGYVEETLGSATGSRGWQESGKADSAEGMREMKKAADERRDGDGDNAAAANTPGGGNSTAGKIEEVTGRLAGCEGMEKEGKGKIEKK